MPRGPKGEKRPADVIGKRDHRLGTRNPLGSLPLVDRPLA
jgi:hypothetical protein